MKTPVKQSHKPETQTKRTKAGRMAQELTAVVLAFLSEPAYKWNAGGTKRRRPATREEVLRRDLDHIVIHLMRVLDAAGEPLGCLPLVAAALGENRNRLNEPTPYQETVQKLLKAERILLKLRRAKGGCTS